MKKVISNIKFTISGIISSILFLAILFMGIPLFFEKTLWGTSTSLYTTQYIYGGALIFFLIVIGIMIPLLRRIFSFCKLKKMNPFDGIATICLAFVSFVSLVILFIVTILLVRIKLLEKFIYKIFHHSIKISLFLLGVWIKIHGLLDKRTKLVPFNHTSSLDYLLAPYVMGIEPYNIIAGINLAENKKGLWNRFIAWSIGYIVKKYTIPVNRDSMISRGRALKKTKEELAKGKRITFSPEGGRTPKKQIVEEKIILQNFKEGENIFKMAWDQKMIIQPVVFDWPVIWRGKSDNWWGIHPCRVDIYFFKPIDPEKCKSLDDFMRICWIEMDTQLRKSKKVQEFLK